MGRYSSAFLVIIVIFLCTGRLVHAQDNEVEPCFLSQDIMLGDDHPDVVLLKGYLELKRNIHLDRSTIFNSKASDTLKDVQKELGLPLTGNLDTQTRAAIFPCPLSGGLEVLPGQARAVAKLKADGKQRAGVNIVYKSTLKFPESSDTFEPIIVFGLKSDAGDVQCGLGFTFLSRNEELHSRSVQVIEPTDELAGAWTSWCTAFPRSDYRVTAAVLPHPLSYSVPGANASGRGYIPSEYHDVLIDVSDETFEILSASSLEE